MMYWPLRIAARYLFARKSHNVINVISAISVVAMAVGTAALIIILSVYNGFGAIVRSMMSSIEPDLMVISDDKRFFVPDDSINVWLSSRPEVGSVCTVLQDNVFVRYEDKQGTALVKGVDARYEAESPVRNMVRDGEWMLGREQLRFAAAGAGFASRMGINHRFLSALELYYPDRKARISALNPMASVNRKNVWPGCVFSVGSEVDNELVIVSRDVMCGLLGCTDEVSAIEIRMKEGSGSAETVRSLKRELSARLPEGLMALERDEQNPAMYRMLRYEKAGVYLIMIFVALILGFSISGCLTMLIIEKTDDRKTLAAMGADSGQIRRVFTLEGWMITLVGMTAGMVLGIIFCMLQQHFGMIKMPGSYIVDAYPVVLQWRDVLLSVLSISAIGYVIAASGSLRVCNEPERK